MAIAGIPNNFLAQQGNGQVLLTWSNAAGATSYAIQRSVDGVNFTALATSAVNQYLDTSCTVGVQYFYQVASVNTSGSSSFTSALSVVPTNAGALSLGELRLMSQQRADRVGSNFVTVDEWNRYINQSYFELYNLLVTTYEDYYFATPYQFQTDGLNQQFPLPANFMKLRGVDLGLANSPNAWVTLKKFNFIERNRNVYPQVTANPLGIGNLQYDIVGNSLMLNQIPQAGQYLRIWFVPRMTQLLKDTDVLDGISGWTEYVIVDAAIKALQKEESTESAALLSQQKMALRAAIEESAANRDAGQAESISDVRNNTGIWGGFGWGGNGGYGGY